MANALLFYLCSFLVTVRLLVESSRNSYFKSRKVPRDTCRTLGGQPCEDNQWRTAMCGRTAFSLLVFPEVDLAPTE